MRTFMVLTASRLNGTGYAKAACGLAQRLHESGAP